MADPASQSAQLAGQLVMHTPPLATVKVQLADGHAATGLFVAFATTPSSGGDSKNAKVMGAAQPNEAPSNQNAGGPSFALGFVDGQGFLQPVHDGWNPWYEIDYDEKKRKKKQGKLTAPPALNPHSWKVAEGLEYRACLIRHPSPAFARAVTAYLNGQPADGSYAVAKLGQPAELVVTVKVESVTEKKVKQLVVKLPADPQSYRPVGAERYGHWLLYYGMPHGNVDTVRDAVATLQGELGKFRYPVGDGDTPYAADAKMTGRPQKPNPGYGVFDLQLAAATHQFQKDAASGKAFVIDASAQGLVGDGTADETMPSWAYLFGVEKEVGPALDSAAVEMGVVDEPTAKAIDKWTSSHYRKPGPILIQTQCRLDDPRFGFWRIWGRPQLVFAIQLWRNLCTIFKCREGIAFGHTFRRVAAKGGVGVAEYSIHKTGLAVDLAVKGSAADTDALLDYAHPAPYWPIRFEAHYKGGNDPARDAAEKDLKKATKEREDLEAASLKAKARIADLQAKQARVPPTRADAVQLEQAQKKAAALDEQLPKAKEKEQAAKKHLDDILAAEKVSKSDHRIHWRLYEHSDWDLAAPDLEASFKTALHDPQQGLVAAFRTAIAHSFPGTLGAPIKAGQELPASAAAIKEALPDVVACVAELEKLTGPELSSKFFRASVHQWNSNPYEADGGTTGPELQASADDGAIDYVNVAEDRSKLRPGSRSFVNVTALAYLSGLRRIGAQRSGWRDVRTDINLSKKPDPRQRIDITPARIGALAGLLVRLQRAGAEHAASSIDLLRDGSVIRSAKIADFDLEFLKDWAQALRSPPSPGATPLGTDMNLEIVAGPAGHKDALIQFVSELAEKKFLVLAIGDQLTVKADPATPMSGDDCAQLIASAHDSLPNEATVAGGGTKDGKTNSKKLSKEAAAKLRPHWSIVLRPLFDAPGATRAEGASPLMMATGDALELPTPGIPRALEWWHYEHFDSADSTWKELVTGIGLSEEILLAPAVPKLQDAPHAFNTAGIGFSSKEVGEVKAGWFDKALPENQWQRPPEGG